MTATTDGAAADRLATDATAAGHPLSPQQLFLCAFDRGDEDGVFGPRYHHVEGWRLRGAVDPATLRAALRDVVERHEALRTEIVRGDGEPRQVVHAAMTPEVVVREEAGLPEAERDHRVQELLNEVEADLFPATRLPLVRALLVRFADDDALLMVNAHHVAIDSWSMQVVIRDLANRYAARRGHQVDPLPPAVQYREYAAHQSANAARYADRAARHWRERLAGARLLAFPTDRPRAESTWPTSSWERFTIGADVRAAMLRVARATRSSPFMVLLSAYKVLLHRLTGATDIVVPTFTPGRDDSRFQHTVGTFFNYVPLRTDIAGCRTFADVVAAVRATCVAAYSNEVPLDHVLAEAPELLSPLQRDMASCVFQVVQPPFDLDGELIGDVRYTSLPNRTLSQKYGSYVPDGILWCLHLGQSPDIHANFAYSRGMFSDGRMARMAEIFVRVTEAATAAPDAPLDTITVGHDGLADIDKWRE